jgi:hypothetical protein
MATKLGKRNNIVTSELRNLIFMATKLSEGNTVSDECNFILELDKLIFPD